MLCKSLLPKTFVAVIITALFCSAAQAVYKLETSAYDSDYAKSDKGIIGIRYLHERGSTSRIIQVYPGTPAAKAGIMPDDRLVSVDGLDIRNYNITQVYDLISGMPGQPIKLQIMRCRRGNCNTFPVNLVRMDMNRVASDNVFRVYRYGL